MDELLFSACPQSEEASARCAQYLAARWRGFGIAQRLLFGREREELVTVLAWHALVRDLHRSAQDAEEEAAVLRELRTILDEVSTGEGDRAIAVALRRVMRRHGLSHLSLTGPLDELAREAVASTYETRHALLRHVRRLAQGETRILLRVLGLEGERNELLADALAHGIQLAGWLACAGRDVEKGHLHFAVEDLSRHRVDILGLQNGRSDDRMRAVVRDQVSWARELLARGWPLTLELGPWRGRLLAFCLRWHAASLSAVEASGHDVLGGPPPTGWLRILACAAASAAGRGVPWRS